MPDPFQTPAFSDADLARLIYLVALLLFIAPAVLTLSHRHRRWMRTAAAAVLGSGLLWALGAVVLWLIEA